MARSTHPAQCGPMACFWMSPGKSPAQSFQPSTQPALCHFGPLSSPTCGTRNGVPLPLALPPHVSSFAWSSLCGCRSPYKASRHWPICLGPHALLHELHVLGEPCIAMAWDIETCAIPCYSSDFACTPYNTKAIRSCSQEPLPGPTSPSAPLRRFHHWQWQCHSSASTTTVDARYRNTICTNPHLNM